MKCDSMGKRHQTCPEPSLLPSSQSYCRRPPETSLLTPVLLTAFPVNVINIPVDMHMAYYMALQGLGSICEGPLHPGWQTRAAQTAQQHLSTSHHP